MRGVWRKLALRVRLDGWQGGTGLRRSWPPLTAHLNAELFAQLIEKAKLQRKTSIQ